MGGIAHADGGTRATRVCVMELMVPPSANPIPARAELPREQTPDERCCVLSALRELQLYNTHTLGHLRVCACALTLCSLYSCSVSCSSSYDLRF